MTIDFQRFSGQMEEFNQWEAEFLNVIKKRDATVNSLSISKGFRKTIYTAMRLLEGDTDEDGVKFATIKPDLPEGDFATGTNAVKEQWRIESSNVADFEQADAEIKVFLKHKGLPKTFTDANAAIFELHVFDLWKSIKKKF